MRKRERERESKKEWKRDIEGENKLVKERIRNCERAIQAYRKWVRGWKRENDCERKCKNKQERIKEREIENYWRRERERVCMKDRYRETEKEWELLKCDELFFPLIYVTDHCFLWMYFWKLSLKYFSLKNKSDF